MRTKIFFCYFFLLGFPVFSTLGQTSFFEAVRSSRKLCGYSITETASRDIIVVGSTFSAGNRDALILRFNSDGKLQWKKAFGGSTLDQFRAVAETSDAGYLVAGFSESFGGGGQTEIALVKFASNGSIQWKKLLGSSGHDGAMSLISTQDGNIVLTGYTSSAGDGDALAIKLNPVNGAIIWQKSYGLPGISEVGFSVSATPNGGIVIAGETQYSKHNHDAFIMKIDAAGNLQWSRILRNSWVEWRSNITEMPVSVTATSDGGAVLALNRGAASNWSPLLVKFNSAGNRIWAKKYGAQDTLRSVRSVSDGFLVTGEWGVITPWFLVFKTDLSGKIKWYRIVDEGDYNNATASAVSADATYFFTGCVNSNTPDPIEAILPLFKLDNLGNINGSCIALSKPNFPFVAMSVPAPFAPISFNTTSLSLQLANSTLGEKSITVNGTTVCKGTGGGSVCGNAKCEAGETTQNCPQDCKEPDPGPVCGNDKCESGENPDICPQDCEQPEPQCHPCYTGPGVCLSPNASDVDCGEISWEDFNACASDPYGLDGDNDGIACES